VLDKILVPLDGSEMGDLVLPYVERLALALGATVILLRVEILPRGWSGGAFRAAAAFLSDVRLPRSETDVEMSQHPIYKDSEMASLEAEAKRTLLPIAERMKAAGIATELLVMFGKPADNILEAVDIQKAGLIVMSTHGEGGPSPWAFGPTAERVSRRAAVPVMFIRPEEVIRILPTRGKPEESDS